MMICLNNTIVIINCNVEKSILILENIGELESNAETEFK